MTASRRPARLHAPALLLASAALAALLVLSITLAAPAQAEPIHVSATSDLDMDPVQARQQAKERAFAEAVYQTSLRLLPAPLPAQRADLLRAFLAPRATALVQSFQEIAAAKPAAPAGDAAQSAPPAKPAANVEKTPPPNPLTLDMDVVVDRQAVGGLLTRLGLMAGPRHPGAFALRLGPGVTEADLAPLTDVLALQGLARQALAPLQVTLERVPQGYLKAVLWQQGKSFVADGKDVAQVWLDLWGRYFSAREQLPGGAGTPIVISGFNQADAVLDFTKVLQSWDDCLREVQLKAVDMRSGNSTGRWTARLTNPDRFEARLKEQLANRKLNAVRQ